ncbi:MAG: sulfate permease [Deltaproteobacteria bacterium]|nr:sulfate permease [Deltaproteobacteria bacterium]
MLTRPVEVVRSYRRGHLRGDLVAGLTVAVVLLPQAIAYAQIAELPPNIGLNAAIVAAVIGGLWGSSHHLQTGPTNAISLIVLSSLLVSTDPGSTEFIVAAGMMAVMAGIFQFAMGVFRLGVLVNFVSHSVVVGFTAGAALLIGIKQIRPLLGLQFSEPVHTLPETVVAVIRHAGDSHPITAAIGASAILLILVLRRIHRKIPGPLLAMVGGAVVVFALGLEQRGVAIVGQLPTGLPPLAQLPLFDLELIGQLSAGALAVAAIGLTEAVSIARSVATKSNQRLDSNQELVGQGLANIACGFLSGYAASGSFSRTAVNYEAGARTSMAGVFSGLIVLITVLTVGSLAAFIPKTALAGVLIVIAIGMIDWREIGRIWRGAPGDTAIMAVTFASTLLLPLEFAVLLGILLSFALYIRRTSVPRVESVVPDDEFVRWIHRPDKPSCPQLSILTIHGDLYFGAVTHVEEEIQAHLDDHPDLLFLLIRMVSVDQCDFAGVHTLFSVHKAMRGRGGDVYFTQVNPRVLEVLQRTDFHDRLGPDHFQSEDRVIAHLFKRVLDPAICIYECPFRVFRECQNLPKREYPEEISFHTEVPRDQLKTIEASRLWDVLHGEHPRLVIDVREPREFRRGHVPKAFLIPLPLLITDGDKVPDEPLVLVCRTGRRSARAAQLLGNRGNSEVTILEGGMLAWEAAGLLEAID